LEIADCASALNIKRTLNKAFISEYFYIRISSLISENKNKLVSDKSASHNRQTRFSILASVGVFVA
jgi:hypothetical protein